MAVFCCYKGPLAPFTKGMNMDIKEFAGNMKEAVQKILGEEFSVETIVVGKNNGVELDALVIRRDDINLSPTMYLKCYYENYLDGETIREGAERLVSEYYEVVPTQNLNMDFYSDYESVKEGLSYKLISRERNLELLENIPHVPFLDLDIVFYYSIEQEGMPDGTILIRNSHMEMWGVNTEDLMRDAGKSAPTITPGVFRDMVTVLKRMGGPEAEFITEAGDFPEMYVVTNENMIFGAAAMLYPGMMSRLAAVLKGNLYIIPSSIHEVIVISEEAMDCAEYLKEMICTVNRTQLKPQDFLSDSLYYFDRTTERITIAS